jgi:hypothetical protein
VNHIIWKPNLSFRLVRKLDDVLPANVLFFIKVNRFIYFLWWLILIANSVELRDYQEISEANLWVCLWGSFKREFNQEGSGLINGLIHWWIKNMNKLLEGVETVERGAWLEEEACSGCAFEGSLVPLDPTSSSLLLGYHEVNSFPPPSPFF